MQRTLFTIDLAVQGTLLGAALILSPTIIIPMLIAIPLGAWQLISALLKGLGMPSKVHLNYFISASAYLFFLYLGSYVAPHLEQLPFYPAGLNKAWSILAVTPPAIGAFWYFHRTYRDFRASVEEQGGRQQERVRNTQKISSTIF